MNNTTCRPISTWLGMDRASWKRFSAPIAFHPSSSNVIADDERDDKAASIGAGADCQARGARKSSVGVSKTLPHPLSAQPYPNPGRSSWWKALKSTHSCCAVQRGGARWSTSQDELASRSPPDSAARQGQSPKTRALSAHWKTWAEDYALMLLDSSGCIFAFYAGAERVYGYKREEVIGQQHSGCI